MRPRRRPPHGGDGAGVPIRADGRAARCGARDGLLRRAVRRRELPPGPPVALLGATPATAEALLQLGNAGVTRLIDVRQPQGWGHLRQLLATQSVKEVDRIALDAVRRELG